MKRKEIIELAKKNGMTEFVPVGKNALWEQIEVWVTMAIEEEREACAKVCEAGINNATDWDSSAWDQACENRSYAIRSRAQADRGQA